MGGLVIRPRAGVLRGHEWVYRNEVQKVFGNPADGDVVFLKDGKDRFLGSAIYNSRSTISARRFSFGRDQLDEEFLRQRLGRAAAYRARLSLDRDAVRLVWSESDGLPGVVVDRYGSIAVLQTLTLAMDQRKSLLASLLMELDGIESVVERNDAAGRKSEGLPESVGLLAGPEPQLPLEVNIGGTKFEVDPLAGQKTGLYLDQSENYAALAEFADGRRVLDCFSNQGGFGLACARRGAGEVVCVDSSEAATDRIDANAARNGVRTTTSTADAFDWLGAAARRSEEFDLVIVDPPSFTRGKARVHDALRGYRELHRQAAKLSRPGGLVASFSCSHHISPEAFLDTLRAGFHESKRGGRVLAEYRQALDHPILLSMPETGYLKGFLIEVI